MIRLEQISHVYQLGKKGGERTVPVLRGINLQVNAGEIVTLVGRSGSGKSTLLHAACGFIRPTGGRVIIDGQDTTKFSEGDWANFRRSRIGVVFQSFQLIPSMTAYENAELPLVLDGVGEMERRERTLQLFERFGLTDYAQHYPGELSGGQQQRVGIARALALRPSIVFADEPTGSLDSENERQFLTTLQQLNVEEQITFLIITHDEHVASIGHRTVRMEDGLLTETINGRQSQGSSAIDSEVTV
ncbi:ABC transporter related protein [Paenibacillus curdlanolyticus YK9]|uniref:ABC transporter related protein n=1 Tax=Paenibacillus curdlanolyticus YK9 TaxID=717606 RepID=E0I9T3_9BACL|nr:ABC transporter ATP-binding protein [Paenibacillus curdlanolyticus]EFM10510.1 ABC transporter related protein [Paenibacillus curdlanolyticus YK9]